MKIEFYKHSIGEEEKEFLLNTLNSVFLTTGPKTAEFETAFAAYLGCRFAVGVTSWTAGAFLVLKSWGIGEGDEVIVPAMTFSATANTVLHVAAKPIFVDVESDTGIIDVAKVEKAITKKTKAMILVHLYGQMADMRSLRELADDYGLKILEDAAHCIEGERMGIRPGALGDAACFSFYATKNITCGEGGAIVTNDRELHKKLKTMRLHGMTKSAAERYVSRYEHWDMEVLGYKANMFDIQAALLIPQLKKIEELWSRREQIAKCYEEGFSKAGIEFPRVLPGVKSARHLFTIWAPQGKRDELLGLLQDEGIGVAVNYRAVHLLKFYRETFGFKEGDFPVAEQIGRRTITLPLYPRLTDEEVKYIIEKVVETVKRLKK